LFSPYKCFYFNWRYTPTLLFREFIFLLY
jgi:hypothetical protein